MNKEDENFKNLENKNVKNENDLSKQFQKKEYFGSSLLEHIKYKYKCWNQKWPILLEDYFGINLRTIITRKNLYDGTNVNQTKNVKIHRRMVDHIIEGETDEVIEVLEQRKLEIDEIIEIISGQRFIHYAVIMNDLDLLEYLIKNKAHLMARDYNGYTPLLKAAALGRNDVIKRLIEEGVPINHKDPWGKTPLDKAKLFDRHETIHLLSAYGEDKNVEKVPFWRNKPLQEHFKTSIWILRQY